MEVEANKKIERERKKCRNSLEESEKKKQKIFRGGDSSGTKDSGKFRSIHKFLNDTKRNESDINKLAPA